MTHQLILRAGAERDIERAQDWYAEQAAGLDAQFTDEVSRTLAVIAQTPHIGRRADHDVRAMPLRTFPYIVWYLVPDDVDVAIVLAVTHQRRDPKRAQA